MCFCLLWVTFFSCGFKSDDKVSVRGVWLKGFLGVEDVESVCGACVPGIPAACWGFLFRSFVL